MSRNSLKLRSIHCVDETCCLSFFFLSHCESRSILNFSRLGRWCEINENDASSWLCLSNDFQAVDKLIVTDCSFQWWWTIFQNYLSSNFFFLPSFFFFLIQRFKKSRVLDETIEKWNGFYDWTDVGSSAVGWWDEEYKAVRQLANLHLRMSLQPLF